MEFACLELAIKCPKCDAPMPLNGPLQIAHCENCQTDTEIELEFWKDSIFDSIFEDLNEFEEGEGRNSTIFCTYNVTLLYGKSTPKCRKCKTPYDLPANLDEDADMFCTGCGEKMSIVKTPQWLKDMCPSIHSVINALLVDKSPEPGEKISGVIVFTCPQCGGALKIDGSERMPVCQFCNTNVYLPDDLWLRMHPAKMKVRWYVACDKPAPSSDE